MPHRPWRLTPFRADAPRRHALPVYASRGAGRRLPRGIGLTLALVASLGLWALLGFAVTKLLDVV